MDPKTIAKKTLFEHDMLSQIGKALDVVLHWAVEGDDASRKLSSVRFISQSLHWHLERLMALENSEGYSSAVEEAHPDLSKEARVAALRHEHDDFRAAMERLMPPLDEVSARDLATFDRLCSELSRLLEALETHLRKEELLLPEEILEEREVLR